MRDLATAQHEAAHVVVGIALGLRLVAARLDPADHPDWEGYAHLEGECSLAHAIVAAAGLAWERRVTGNLDGAAYDLRNLRRLYGCRGKGAKAKIRTLERAAWAILEARGAQHARLSRILAERDLTGADIRALVRGEKLRGEGD